MKKIYYCRNPYGLQKGFRIMRITIFLCLISVIQTFAISSLGQVKLDLKIRNTTIEEVLQKIEENTNFRFFYQSEDLKNKQHINIEFEQKSVRNILDEVLPPLQLKYEVFDNYIAIKSVQEELNNQESVQDQKSVTGKVTDSSGSLLPGVTVVVKGTTQGTVTDADGEYSLSNIPEDAILQFSFVGMRTQEVDVAGQTTVDVVMEEDAIGIEEVVAIGYGTQKKVNVIGSVTSVSSDELTSAPVSRVSNALAGRLPGGIFMQESGEPGNDAAIIRIRGNSSLGNNSPLIVIDGIPGRDLNSLHPEDIESVTVLKDASAGIYGARAANGVILVNTKGGKLETAATFTYNFHEGFLSPTMLPEMADAPTYATMIRENQSYRNVDESNMLYSVEDIAKYESGDYPWTHPNTDWFAEALKNYSTTQHHGLSVSGGTKNVSYYGSFGSQSDNGIYTNSATSYKRYNLKARIDVQINEYLSLGIDMTGIQENRMYPTKSASSIFNATRRMYPTQHALFPNGLPGPDIEYGDQPMVSASFETGFDDDKRYRSNNLLSATLKIPWIEGLNLSGYYAYDMYIQQRREFEKPWTLYSLDVDAYLAAGNTGKEDGSAFLLGTSKGGFPEPRLTNYSNNSNSKTANIKLDYNNTFDGKHNVSAFVSYEQNEYYSEGFNAFRRYFLTDKLPYLFAGGDAEKDNDGWASLDSRMNYFGRFSYNYKETYLFQFSFRRDGSLRFSKESGRWGNFPSVLIGWRPSEEEWWANNIGFIDHFKLRASWGQMGNDLVDAYQYLASYGFTQGTIFGEDKEYNAGLVQANAPNPNITWEVANVYNVGFEAILLNNKLSLDADFFYERRNNILVQRNASVPIFTGISLPDENFGIVDNKGVEVLLGYNNSKGDFRYNLSGNFAFARNKIVEYDEAERNVPWQVRTGLPQGAHLLYKYIGVFRDEAHVNSLPHVTGARPGDLIIEDFDGDGEITNDDRQLFPLTATPELTFGFTFNLSYRNWGLNGLVQGQGRALRNVFDDISGTGGNYNQFDADGRWTPENPDAKKPRAFERQEEYWRGSHITDYYYQDVSFARLKNLQLSYTIPRNLAESVMLKNAKVYFAGQNLLLLYSGNKLIDPELPGINSYPIMRVLSLGAQLTF